MIHENQGSHFAFTAQDKINYLNHMTSDQQIHCVLSLDSQVCESLMAKAVALSIKAEPVLGCRLMEDPIQPFWEVSDFDFEPCAIVQTAAVNDELVEYLTKPINPFQSPQIEVKIFRNNHDTLCIKVSHGVCDAVGLKDYLKLLSSIYCELVRNPDYKITGVSMKRRDQSQVFEHIPSSEKYKAMALARNIIEPTWGIPFRSSSRLEPGFGIARIEKEQFLAIKKFAKQNNTTLNDLFIAAFYTGLYESINPEPGKPMRILVPIDLRRYIPSHQAETICSLSGVMYPEIIYTPGDNFGDLLLNVTREMNRLKQNYPGLASAFQFEFVSNLAFSKEKEFLKKDIQKCFESGMAHPVLTNMGVISDTSRAGAMIEFGDSRAIDAFMVTPTIYAPYFMAGVSSYHETLTVTIGYYRSQIPEKSVARFLEIFLNSLPG